MWAKANKIEDFNDDKLYDPETNIRVGTWYLNRSIKRWSQTDDPVTFALAEYNAGHSNALKWVDPLAPQSHLRSWTASPSRARASTSRSSWTSATSSPRDFAN